MNNDNFSQWLGANDRRRWLKSGLAATAATVAGAVLTGTSAAQDLAPQPIRSEPAIVNGKIRQSVMGWCFNPMPTLELAAHCKAIGLEAMEGIDTKFYPDVLKLGLKISLLGSHGFKDGPTNRDNHANCIAKLNAAIDLAGKVGCDKVITFTGMTVPGMDDATAQKNCIDCWQQVIKKAESAGVTLCLEHLNSRDDTHPMKGHPGYYGDDVELCIDLIKRVDSPNMKLLFDIYHVQIMHGDIIRRIRQHHPWIAHYHTAGNPGRCELDENQEIQYPAIMRAILETGYAGYVAQEFIPTWPDPIAALRQAAKVCDVG